MKRRIVLALCLTGLLSSPAFAQTGQINGVVTDNTGAVVPGVTVKALEVATGLSRDTVSGADGRYTFTSLRPTTYDITAELQGFRTSQRKGLLLQANENLTVNFAIELGDALGNGHGIRRVADGRRHVVGPQRSRRSEAHRRTAAERPRRGEAEHAGGRHGADRGRSGIREDDSRRAAAVDQRHRGAAGVVPAGRHEPHRSVLPAEPAVPVPRRAAGVQHPDQQLQRGPGQQRRRGGQRRHALGHQRLPRRRRSATCATARSTRENFFSPEKDFLKRRQEGGFLGGPIQHNKTFFFVGCQNTRPPERGHDEDRDGPDGRAARRQLRQHAW